MKEHKATIKLTEHELFTAYLALNYLYMEKCGDRDEKAKDCAFDAIELSKKLNEKLNTVHDLNMEELMAL